MAFDAGAGRRFLTRTAMLVGLALGLAGALAGAGVGLLRPPASTASATILLNPLDGNPFSTSTRGDNLANLETEAQLVTSQDVVQRVIASTGTTLDVEVLVGAVEVGVPTNTQLMEIEAHARRPEVAVELAQVFADDFLASRRERAMQQSQAQILSLEEEVTARQKERAALEAQLAGTSAGSAQTISSQIDSVNAQIISLQSRIAQLRTSPSDPGQIVTPSTIEPSQLWRRWWVLSLIGGLGGLALGVGIALLRARAAAARLVRRRVLGTLGPVDLAAGPGDPTPAARDLALGVLTSDRRRPLTMMLVSDAIDGPSCTTALAGAIAATGNATIVVDITDASTDGEGQSLAALLSDTPPPLGVPEDLTWITAGDLKDAEDLLLSPRMEALIAALRARAEVVVIATGSPDGYAARALVDLVDAVITESHRAAGTPHAWMVEDLGTVLLARQPEGHPGAS